MQYYNIWAGAGVPISTHEFWSLDKGLMNQLYIDELVVFMITSHWLYPSIVSYYYYKHHLSFWHRRRGGGGGGGGQERGRKG